MKKRTAEKERAAKADRGVGKGKFVVKAPYACACRKRIYCISEAYRWRGVGMATLPNTACVQQTTSN